VSEQRADKVANILSSARQPVIASGLGPTGAPGDASNRRADISLDHLFEGTYSGNAYSVAPHEVGHMFGLPDEYSNLTSGLLAGVQTNYDTLLTSVGLSVPSYGQDTSSIMSNGVDILPGHYATFWEALGLMTQPDIQPSEWTLG
jgi:hypothetical protein